LAATLARLELAGFLCLEGFAGKSPCDTSCQLGSLVCLSPRNGTGIRKTCRSFCRHREATVAKKGTFLNSWTANSPTHINQYVSGLT
jgi:hypothetical protein